MSVEAMKTIQQQLFSGRKMKVWSWGTHACKGLLPHNIASVKGPTLQFAVNGHHFKGHVRMELDESTDLYNIQFGRWGSGYENQWEHISSTKGIFAENLTETLDQLIEYIPMENIKNPHHALAMQSVVDLIEEFRLIFSLIRTALFFNAH